jgi:hypothetical protein
MISTLDKKLFCAVAVIADRDQRFFACLDDTSANYALMPVYTDSEGDLNYSDYREALERDATFAYLDSRYRFTSDMSQATDLIESLGFTVIDISDYYTNYA